MDNPQHYQPLSHALQYSHSYTANPSSSHTSSSAPSRDMRQALRAEEEEDEEDEEDEDEGVVEEQLEDIEPDQQPAKQDASATQPDATNAAANTSGTVSAHDTSHAHASSNAAPASVDVPATGPERSQQAHRAKQQSTQQDADASKRKPGRPRGSRNRRARPSAEISTPSTSSKPTISTPLTQQHPAFYQYSSTPAGHNEVNSQNQQYYEFQWRVLNLCAEFYTAAEELVKATPSLVIAQCYQMGPTIKVDPISMLGDAKRICDTLLTNPSRLTQNPPPPIYPVIPAYHIPSAVPQPGPSQSVSAAPSTSKAASPANVITNPQTFVVPLGQGTSISQHSMQPVPYPTMYAPPGQYPTTSYYQYQPYTHGNTYYTTPQPAQSSSTAAATTTQSASAPPAASTTTQAQNSGSGGNQGAWSDEETEKLKQLAEESKKVGSSSEIEWDWVVHQWGNTRTRHQILIKATSLGLKESSSRGIKRRREEPPEANSPAASVPPAAPTPAPLPAPVQVLAPAPAPTTSTSNLASLASIVNDVPSAPSPAQSQTASTPVTSAHQSPAIHHARPPSSHLQTSAPPPVVASSSNSNPAPTSSTSTSSTSRLPWPMPTVAANTPSPVITARESRTQSVSESRQDTYRFRNTTAPTSGPSTSPKVPKHGITTHHYMYQPNGNGGSHG